MNIQVHNYNLSFNARPKYPVIPKAELQKYIQQGYTQQKISEICNVPNYVVSRYALTYGLLQKQVRNEEKIISQINSMHNAGYSLEEIRRTTGESLKFITSAIKPKEQSDTTVYELIEKLNLTGTDILKNLKL